MVFLTTDTSIFQADNREYGSITTIIVIQEPFYNTNNSYWYCIGIVVVLELLFNVGYCIGISPKCCTSVSINIFKNSQVTKKYER